MTDWILEPPGTIGIFGGDVLGLEAALYGRFLGYEVTVFEPASVAAAWLEKTDRPLAFLPHRGLSPLALQAIEAQQPTIDSTMTLPTSTHGWGAEIVRRLANVDLLAGRVLENHRVVSLQRVPNEEAPDELDFEVHCENHSHAWCFEAILDISGIASSVCDASIDLSDEGNETPYLFRIAPVSIEASDDAWETARKAVRDLFAMLGERPSLDLYRPRRS